MMSISVNIPEELYRQAMKVAEAHGVAIDEVFAAALADQMAAWERVQERAARGDRDKFIAVLNKVPDVESEVHDGR